MRHPRPSRLAAMAAAGVAVAGIVSGVSLTGGLHQSSPHAARVAATTSVPAQRATPVRVDRARRADPRVARPQRLVNPDAIIRLHHKASARALRRFARIDGVNTIAALSRGRVFLNGHRVTLVGADLQSVRRFTPTFTARSQPLWDSLARGELTVSYSRLKTFRRSLGATLVAHMHDRMTLPVRVGAFASLGLGKADGLVDATTGMMLGLNPARELVVSAHRVDMNTLRAEARAIFGGRTGVTSLRPKQVDQMVLSDYARATIPTSYLQLYRSAATTCAGLPWTVLAAIGAVETGHGANTHVSSKGAVGPMQFLPSTFAAYAVDGDRDGVADIHDPADAVYTAARYLCLWGAGRGGQAMYDAVFAYNHADWYVREVFALANAYA